MRRITITGLAVATWLAATAGTALAAPANDDFEHAIGLGSGPTAIDGTLDGATVQVGEPTTFRHDVWYSFTPGSDDPIAVELAATNGVDVPPLVFTGPDRTHLQSAGTIDTSSWRVRLTPEAGTTYWVAVGNSWDAQHTSFTLRTRRAVAPSNDTFDGVRKVGVPGLYHGNMAEATGELGERGPQNTKPAHSVWYRFKAKYTGRLTVEATNSTCWPGVGVAVSTGTDLSSLHTVATAKGVVRFHAQRGHRYNVQVDCQNPGLGDYTLDLSDGSVSGKGLGAEIAKGQTVERVRHHGLKLTVSTRRETTVDIDLVLGKKAMHRLGLHDRVIGHVRGHLDPNDRVPAAIALTRAAKRALDGRDRLSATVRLTLLSNAPNRVMDVPVSLPN